MKTFLNLPQSEISKADVVILPVPLEKTVSFLPGAARFPELVLEVSDQIEEYDEGTGFNFETDIKIHTAAPCVFYNQCIDNCLPEIKQTADEYNSNSFVLGIGGEHSATLPLVQSCMPQPGTIVSVDAHTDLRDEYEGSKFSHACVMKRLADIGHKIIVIGPRAISKEEHDLDKTNDNINIFRAQYLQNQSVYQKLFKTLESLTGNVYLTIDLDGLDLSIAPGVGTPMAGGLGWWQLLEIMRALIITSPAKLSGADVVEGIPLHGNDITQMTAAMIIGKIISYLFAR